MLKKYLLTLSMMIFICIGILSSQTVQINLPGKGDGSYSYLVKDNINSDTLAMSAFKDGVSKLKCKDCPKGLFQVIITGVREPTFLVIDKSNIKLRYGSDSGSEPNAVFENSEANALLQRILALNEQYHNKRDSLSLEGQRIYEFDTHYKKKAKAIRLAYDELHKQHNSKLDEFATQTSNEYITEVLIPVLKFSVFKEDNNKYDNERAFQHYEFFKHIDFSKQQLVGDPFFANKLNEYLMYFGGHGTLGKQESCGLLINLSGVNPDVQRYVVEILMEAYFNVNDLDMVEFINQTANEASCELPQELSWELKEYLEQTKGLQPGKKAPDVSLKDQGGKPLLLSSIAGSNKYAIVFFWATWCSHCMDILPKLQRLYPELKSKGAEIFAVSLDESYEDWVLTLADYKTPWVNVSERKKWDTKAVSDYNIRATPTFYLLKNDMTIVGKYTFLEDLKRELSIP